MKIQKRRILCTLFNSIDNKLYMYCMSNFLVSMDLYSENGNGKAPMRIKIRDPNSKQGPKHYLFLISFLPDVGYERSHDISDVLDHHLVHTNVLHGEQSPVVNCRFS